MARFSLAQRITLLFVFAGICVAIFALLNVLTDWRTLRLVGAAVLLGFVGDIVTALSMQAVAPTKVDIGPGEKAFSADASTERGVVISGFDGSPQGQGSIWGETWQAIQVPNTSEQLTKGTVVQVVDREGLTLILKASAC